MCAPCVRRAGTGTGPLGGCSEPCPVALGSGRRLAAGTSPRLGPCLPPCPPSPPPGLGTAELRWLKIAPFQSPRCSPSLSLPALAASQLTRHEPPLQQGAGGGFAASLGWGRGSKGVSCERRDLTAPSEGWRLGVRIPAPRLALLGGRELGCVPLSSASQLPAAGPVPLPGGQESGSIPPPKVVVSPGCQPLRFSPVGDFSPRKADGPSPCSRAAPAVAQCCSAGRCCGARVKPGPTSPLGATL